jgi:hypothetical protein
VGTVNLITPAKRKAAAALVTEGYSVSLSRDTDTQQAVDNGAPFSHRMSAPVDNQFNMDEYSISFHGFAHTLMDALSHVFYQGQMYNGFPQSSVKPGGAEFLAVTAYREGIFTRGVLVDIPWLRLVPYLEATDVIYPEELDAWEKIWACTFKAETSFSSARDAELSERQKVPGTSLLTRQGFTRPAHGGSNNAISRF